MKPTFNQLLNKLSYLIVFLLPWQTKYIFVSWARYNLPWENDKLGLYGIDILLGLLLIIGFKKFIGAENNNRYRLSLYISAWLILLTSLLGIYTAIDKIFVLMGVTKLFLAMSLWWGLINFKIDFKKLLYAFFYGAGTVSLLGIYQFLAQKAMASTWLGLAAHTASDLGTSVIEIFGGGRTERWLRAYGSLDHPNIFAGYLAVAWLVYIFLYSRQKTHLNRANRNSSSLLKILDLVFLISINSALFFTFSRAGLIAAAVSGLILIIGDFKNYKLILKPIIVSLIIFLLLFIDYGYLYLPRINTDSRLEQKSLTERQLYLKEAGDLIKEKPLLGHSYGNYLSALQIAKPNQDKYSYQPVHNFWLLIWAETGIITMLAMLALWMTALYGSLKNLNSRRELKIFNLSLISSLFIFSVFDHWLWSNHFGIVFYWFIFAIITKNLSDDGLF